MCIYISKNTSNIITKFVEEKKIRISSECRNQCPEMAFHQSAEIIEVSIVRLGKYADNLR